MSKSAIALIALILVSTWLVLANSVPTTVGCGDGTTYDPSKEPNYAANVNTVVEGMRVSTATAQGRAFSIYLTNPNVYGSSTCLVDAPVNQCIACLTLAENDMRNTCGTTREGSGSRPVCSMEYGPYN